MTQENTYDLTPDWFDNYEQMLDIVHPQRDETIIFELDNNNNSNTTKRKEID
jgi:hypothetical protein